MPRHRQVRLGYPQAFIELALLLAVRHGRRHAARIMAVPLSTVYRWFDQHRRSRYLAGVEKADAQWLQDRLADCEAHGFDLHQRFASLTSRAAQPAPSPGCDDPPVMSAGAPLRPAATHERVSRRHAVVAASLSPAVRARVERARAEIERHYYSHLSCERLASLAGMSRFHFIRTFKSAFATAPYHYLMNVRIRHARELLSTTTQPLDTVASAVGFDSQSSLCKAFRSVEGVSLSNYFRGMRLGSQMPRLDSHT